MKKTEQQGATVVAKAPRPWWSDGREAECETVDSGSALQGCHGRGQNATGVAKTPRAWSIRRQGQLELRRLITFSSLVGLRRMTYRFEAYGISYHLQVESHQDVEWRKSYGCLKSGAPHNIA